MFYNPVAVAALTVADAAAAVVADDDGRPSCVWVRPKYAPLSPIL